jgi:hypothetical protein
MVNQETPLGGLLPHEPSVGVEIFTLETWPKLSELPIKYEEPRLSLKDQVAELLSDGCVAYSGASAQEPRFDEEFYAPFVFAAAKSYTQDPMSWGLTQRNMGKALKFHGAPRVEYVPESVNQLSRTDRRFLANYQSVTGEARQYKAKSFSFIENSSGPYDAFDMARAAFWALREEKIGISFGLRWAWQAWQGWSAYKLDHIDPNGFGHSLRLAGWKVDEEKTWLLVDNSYGTRAGINGQHLVSRETFNHWATLFGLMVLKYA